KVQPAVGSGQEDAKEPSAGKVPRQSLRQAPASLNAITLRENPRPKGTGCLDSLGCRVASSHRASSIARGGARSGSDVGLTLAMSRGGGGGARHAEETNARGSQRSSQFYARRG